jgi:hypothetical protein
MSTPTGLVIQGHIELFGSKPRDADVESLNIAELLNCLV